MAASLLSLALFGIEFTLPMLIGIALGIVALILVIIIVIVASVKGKKDKEEEIEPIYDERDPETGRVLPKPEPVEEAQEEQAVVEDAQPAEEKEPEEEIATGTIVSGVDENEFLDAEV